MAAADRPGDTAKADGGAPTARRIMLGAQLRRLREASEISRADAGYLIRASESKISRMELGRVGLKDRDVADLLTMYGINDEQERTQFLTMVGESNEPGWWQRYNDLMPGWFHNFVGLEESASRIITYELQFVPGLLQTQAYATSIASRGRPELATEDAKRRVALRMRRQKLLARPDAPKYWAIVDESVLRRPIGGAATTRDQIDYLLEVTKLPHITLQIVPTELSGYAAEGAFSLLRFAEQELPDVVYVEHLGGALYLDRRDEVELYSRVVDRLTVDALTPDHSRQLLAKIRTEL